MTHRRRLRDRLCTISGIWPWLVLLPLAIVVTFAPIEPILMLTASVMAVTAAGCIAFILGYPPYWPWRHDVYGRNLLMLCWWLLAWILVAFVQLLIPMPLRLGIGLQLIAFAGVGTVIWDRVFLVPRARREVEAERLIREGGDSHG